MWYRVLALNEMDLSNQRKISKYSHRKCVLGKIFHGIAGSTDANILCSLILHRCKYSLQSDLELYNIHKRQTDSDLFCKQKH